MADAYGITRPDGWNDSLGRVLAECGARLVRELLWADSLGEGYSASNRWGTSWWALHRADMQASHGNGGDGFLSVVGTPSASAAPPDPIVEVGTWSAFIGGLGAQVVGTSGEGLLFPQVQGRKVEMWWQPDYTFSSILSLIAGVTESHPVQIKSLAPMVELLALGSAVPRDVALFVEAGGGGNVLTGIEATNRNGFVVDNVAHFGVTSAYVDAPGYIGATSPNLVGEYVLARNYHRPDILVYALMVNDWGLGVPVNTYATNTRRTLDLARARHPGMPIVIVVNHPGTGALGTYNNYVAKAYEIAAEYDACVVDLWERSGHVQGVAPFVIGGAGYFADAVHLNDAGHAWVHESVKRALNVPAVRLLAA